MNATDLNMNSTIYFKMSPFGYYSVGFLVMTFGIFGICSNAVSTAMFIKVSKFRTTVDMLLLNLALADILKTGVCFPFIVSSSFAQHWLFGDVGCTLYGFLSFLLGNASITTLGAISVERYFIICRRYQASILRRRAFLVKVIGFIWFQAFVWATLPITTGVDYTLEPFQTSCTVNWKGKTIVDRVFILGLVTIVVLGNILTMMFCYVRIYITSQQELIQQRTIQDVVVTKVCFLLLLGFLLCWLPYATVSMWGAYGDPSSIPQAVTVVPVVLAKMSTCINPLLYILSSKKFRKRFFDVIKCKRLNRAYPSNIIAIQSSFRSYNVESQPENRSRIGTPAVN